VEGYGKETYPFKLANPGGGGRYEGGGESVIGGVCYVRVEEERRGGWRGR
jgi:hypothetical protein